MGGKRPTASAIHTEVHCAVELSLRPSCVFLPCEVLVMLGPFAGLYQAGKLGAGPKDGGVCVGRRVCVCGGGLVHSYRHSQEARTINQ